MQVGQFVSMMLLHFLPSLNRFWIGTEFEVGKHIKKSDYEFNERIFVATPIF